MLVVLTKSYDLEVSQKMKSVIEQKNLRIVQIVPVVSKPFVFNGGENTVSAFGLEKLIEIMDNCLPEVLRDTLQSVQIVSLNLKRKQAITTISLAATAAAGAALTPLPVADCVILVPIEIGMLTSITIIYGVEDTTGFMANFLYSTIGCGSASLLGKFAVSTLLKFIPGIGSALAAAISSATASTLTTSLGFAYIPIMEKLFKNEVDYQSMPYEEFKAKSQELFELKKENK